MNRIILLGHPSSSLAAVEGLLKQSGLQAALPSKRDGLSPLQITDTLCQAHECIAIADAMSEEELLPIQAGTVWHGLALDLLLGNLQQPLWGWSDPRSIFWLDYWASLDPHATFILVYDHPVSLLQVNALNLHGQNLDMAIPRLMENWQAYNGVMLRFQSRESQRCLLINAQRAREQLGSYLSDLSSRLHGKGSAALELESNQATESISDVVKGHDNNRNINYLENSDPSNALDHIKLSNILVHSPDMVQWLEGNSALDQHLLHQLIQQYPLAIQIYEELEAASSVITASADAAAPNIHPGQAWVQLIQQRQAIADVLLSFYQQMQDQIAQINQLKQENREVQSKLDNASLLKSTVEPAQLKELEEENDLLLTQLHTVQEELERYYLENQELLKKQAKPKSKPYGAAERIQQQLSYRLGASMISNSRSLGGWLKMPFSLIGVTRAYRKDRRVKENQKLPPIHTYADAHDAERYRQHLSFQLGQTMLKYIKTPWGWMWMPFALAGTAKAFKKSRR